MTPLLIGLAVGTAIGVVGTLLLVVDPLRRERELFRDRIIREQMRTFGAEARLQAHKSPTLRSVPPLPEVVKPPAVEFRGW